MTNLGDYSSGQTPNNIMNKIEFIDAFNSHVWSAIWSKIGGALYTAPDGQVTLSQDRFGFRGANNDYIPNGANVITVQGRPRYSKTAETGQNVVSQGSASAKISKPYVIPVEYLENPNANTRKFFTLKPGDFAATDPKIIRASELYEACLKVASALTAIRPFRGLWTHYTDNANLGGNIRLSMSASKHWNNLDWVTNNQVSGWDAATIRYGIFRPASSLVSTTNNYNAVTASSTPHNGSKNTRWSITQGSSVTSLYHINPSPLNANAIASSSPNVTVFFMDQAETKEIFMETDGTTKQFYTIAELVNKNQDQKINILHDLQAAGTVVLYPNGTRAAVNSTDPNTFKYTGNVYTKDVTVDKVSNIAGEIAYKSRGKSLIDNFYQAWESRCYNRNIYKFHLFSCHMNCHSNCHSSCHGNRSRR